MGRYDFYNDEITYIAIIQRNGRWLGIDGLGWHQAVYIKAGGKHYLAHYSTNTGNKSSIYSIDGPITKNNPTWRIINDESCENGTTIGQIAEIQDNTSYNFIINNCATFAIAAFDMATGIKESICPICHDAITSRDYCPNCGVLTN